MSMLTRRDFVLSMSALAIPARAMSALAAAGSGTALACPAPATARLSSGCGAHSVLMLNAACDDPGVANVFEPMILHVDSGDTVTFIPTDAGHNSTSKRGMIPQGAAPWNGVVDGELTVEFTIPGIYGHICIPHYEWGMVGLIVVGNDLHNLEAVRKIRHPGAARGNFRALLKRLEG